MYNKLFIELLKKISIPQRKCFVFNKLDNIKIKNVINTLSNYSKKYNQNILFLIYTYAYFYVTVFNNYNLSHIQLLVFRFLEHIKTLNLPNYNSDDCERAFDLFECWNNMHKLTSSDVPFTLRKMLSEAKIKIFVNTYFQHNANYLHFFQMAYNINTNVKYFPKIHSYQEFFLHLPILTKWAKTYYTTSYLKLDTLDKYYRKTYDDVEWSKRLRLFLRNIQATEENLEIYKKSKIFGAQYAIIYVGEKLKERNC